MPRITFGNHFCDGDSSKLRIQNGQAKLLQLNVHTFGALYGYNNDTGLFDFISGENIEITDGVDFEVDYPKHVGMFEGHPEIFVSNGSHGNWGAPGEIKLSAFCFDFLRLKNHCLFVNVFSNFMYIIKTQILNSKINNERIRYRYFLSAHLNKK